MEDDELLMRRALALAGRAGRRGEVPVAALAVAGGRVIAAASNRMERGGTPPIMPRCGCCAPPPAAAAGGGSTGSAVVVTLEPCPMCAGAMVQARVDRCVYGARDPKKGADGSVYEVASPPR